MSKTNRTIALLAGVTLIVLALTIALPALRMQPAGAQQQATNGPVRQVSVSGTGIIRVVPDLAIVRLGVQSDAATAAAALTDNNTRMAALIAALKDAGVAAEDIQTQGIGVYPRYVSTTPESAPEIHGYTATNAVEVRVRDLSQVGTLLEKSVTAGGNTVEGVRFEVSDQAAALDQAREAAMADARHKAEQLAGLAGAQLGAVLVLSESGLMPDPIMYDRMAVEAGNVPVEPGQQMISVTIQASWLLP